MQLYSGIDLHSNNSYVAIQDERERSVFSRRLPNNLMDILEQLEPYRENLVGIAVESTFNWYWLVDGLVDAKYRVQLANPSAMTQYAGLKYTDDQHDARWLARLLKLGILPTGYICPKKERAVRDLMRRRSFLVRHRTASLLSLKSLYSRHTGRQAPIQEMRRWDIDEIGRELGDPNLKLALCSTWAVIETMTAQIRQVEKAAHSQGKLKKSFHVLHSTPGIGDTLALTIMYEVGDIGRFPRVGDYASYCRVVPSKRTSNSKKKGQGNKKNGNPYLSWAYSEAAHHMLRFEPRARRFYDRKKSKKGEVLARRALASKISRANYFMLRDQTMFDPDKAFS